MTHSKRPDSPHRPSSPRPPKHSGDANKDKKRPKKDKEKHRSDKDQKRPGPQPKTPVPAGPSLPAMKQLFLAAALTAGAKFSSTLGDDDAVVTPSGASGDFDLYLLAQSWAPRFCCTNKRKCQAERMEANDGLSIHGLWPAYWKSREQGRTYPAYCSKSDESEKSRMGHEWAKHGTCTSLSRDDYFREELRAATQIDLPVTEGTLTVEALAEALGGPRRVAVMSDDQCRLQELTTCWSKNPDGSVGEQIDCPKHILGSSRNSAMRFGCASVLLDQKGTCSIVTEKMLSMLKAADSSQQ